ncbi:hypothetical protein B0A52_08188 [Exophiala mesophila]|uniref:MT-A70-domain-containing protein n=1 Tax=Exophiala mesophila TaxID=212818 RepID=A0A438MXJ6_EXOME|nr:hypothetical protein B0A52_08188 [Exophiala mesophila]
MPTPFLFHNPDYSIVLLDLPSSIQHAQHSQSRLASSPVIEIPYPSNEPGEQKRGSLLAALSIDDQAFHSCLQHCICEAIATIQKDYIRGQNGNWHVPRHEVSRPNEWPRELPATQARASSGICHGLKKSTHGPFQPSVVPMILSTTEWRTVFPSLQAVSGIVIHNPPLPWPRTSLMSTDEGEFVIPPEATFIHATLESGLQSFIHGSQTLFAPHVPLFDLILMDPPWTNRSARRSSHYLTAQDQPVDPFDQAVHIVQCHLQSPGLVAVWITNKSSIRHTVLDRFRTINMALWEEWVWVKVTSQGVPVTQLDGFWRRPYELCLIFRRASQPPGMTTVQPRRRVIAAVPDLHSRKPSLKPLLEQLLPDNYQALELFARSLTAGWWSWGDEVLKFQSMDNWVQDDVSRLE